jgi:hypothetical protein
LLLLAVSELTGGDPPETDSLVAYAFSSVGITLFGAVSAV